MELFGIHLWGKKEGGGLPEFKAPPPPPRASAIELYVSSSPVYGKPYNGEKNLGEAGPIIKYTVDHEALRLRSWQLYLESEICQTVIKRFARWVIGSGLKLQAEPQIKVLEGEKIKLDAEEFNEHVEAQFKVFSNSTMSDYNGMRSLNAIAEEAFINSKMGDVLVILRLIGGIPKVQLIDGAHVATPLNLAYNGLCQVAENGNRVKNGIETDAKGQPVAYYVRTNTGILYDYKRVPVRGPKGGALMAFMVYGLRYRLDDNRGLSLLSAVMETVKGMERYKSATLGSAEERAKVPYSIEHTADSTGENPLASRAANAYDYNPSPGDDLPRDMNGVQLARQVAATTNKQVVNMPVGATLKSMESDNELYFKDFYTVNIDLVCAAVGIPPNVAMSKYDSNFSASRAALKDWEHTLSVERKRFADQFYMPIYRFWLEVQILTNKVQAPGYLAAMASGNVMALEAYTFARFVGANVPHIDPEKEVRAERLKLGDSGAHLPLTTVEAATENLNGGDYRSNVKQYGRELTDAADEGVTAPVNNTGYQEEEETEKKTKP